MAVLEYTIIFHTNTENTHLFRISYAWHTSGPEIAEEIGPR